MGRARVECVAPSDARNATRTAKVVIDQIRELCLITVFSLYDVCSYQGTLLRPIFLLSAVPGAYEAISLAT
jgi:hypothetical protein